MDWALGFMRTLLGWLLQLTVPLGGLRFLSYGNIGDKNRPGWKRLVKLAGTKHVKLLPVLHHRQCGQGLKTIPCGIFFFRSDIHVIVAPDLEINVPCAFTKFRLMESATLNLMLCTVLPALFAFDTCGTKNRLQQHLLYVSRKGLVNSCGAWVRHMADPFSALPGALRTDAVVLAGPHVLGASKDDVDWLEAEFFAGQAGAC